MDPEEFPGRRHDPLQWRAGELPHRHAGGRGQGLPRGEQDDLLPPQDRQDRVCLHQPHLLLHRWPGRGQVLADSSGLQGPSGRGDDPHGLREGVHLCGGDEVRRAQGGRNGVGSQGGGKVQAGGKELRRRGRRRHFLQVQRREGKVKQTSLVNDINPPSRANASRLLPLLRGAEGVLRPRLHEGLKALERGLPPEVLPGLVVGGQLAHRPLGLAREGDVPCVLPAQQGCVHHLLERDRVVVAAEEDPTPEGLPPGAGHGHGVVAQARGVLVVDEVDARLAPPGHRVDLQKVHVSPPPRVVQAHQPDNISAPLQHHILARQELVGPLAVPNSLHLGRLGAVALVQIIDRHAAREE
mmetsp:Transcript_472/g.1801  ORF Transcript_472/g.1801 Transcript_472/m.1801 type:complete len:354 (+) Transcript_472:823-1884(+)